MGGVVKPTERWGWRKQAKQSHASCSQPCPPWPWWFIPTNPLLSSFCQVFCQKSEGSNSYYWIHTFPMQRSVPPSWLDLGYHIEAEHSYRSTQPWGSMWVPWGWGSVEMPGGCSVWRPLLPPIFLVRILFSCILSAGLWGSWEAASWGVARRLLIQITAWVTKTLCHPIQLGAVLSSQQNWSSKL